MLRFAARLLELQRQGSSELTPRTIREKDGRLAISCCNNAV